MIDVSFVYCKCLTRQNRVHEVSAIGSLVLLYTALNSMHSLSFIATELLS